MKKFLLLILFILCFSCDNSIKEDSVFVSYAGTFGSEFGSYATADRSYRSLNDLRSIMARRLLTPHYQIDYVTNQLISFNYMNRETKIRVIDFYDIDSMELTKSIEVKSVEHSPGAHDLQIRNGLLYYTHTDNENRSNYAIYKMDLNNFEIKKIYSIKSSFLKDFIVIDNLLVINVQGHMELESLAENCHIYDTPPYKIITFTYDIDTDVWEYLAHSEFSYSEKYKLISYIEDETYKMVIHDLTDNNITRFDLSDIDISNIWEYQVINHDMVFVSVFDHKEKWFDPLGGIFGTRYDNYFKLYLVNSKDVIDFGMHKNLSLFGSF